MQCADCHPLLCALADGQPLEPAQQAALDEHVRGCASCAQALADQRSTSAALREHGERYRAPASLRAKLRMQQAPAPDRAPGWSGWMPRLGYAATFATGVLLALLLQPYFSATGGDRQLAEELVAGHVRSLMVEHLSDVASSDHHTVKPWFAGKLDYSPPVTDFAAQGFALSGGRLDYIGGRAVAALVYRHGPHVINLYVWPARGGAAQPPRMLTERGYNLVSWQSGGMTWWAVSDLNAGELESFARLLT